MGHHAGFHRSSGGILSHVSTPPAAHLTSYLPSRHRSSLTREHQESAFSFPMSSHTQPISHLCWAQDTSQAARSQGDVNRETKANNVGTFKNPALKEDMTHTFHLTNLIRDKRYICSHILHDPSPAPQCQVSKRCRSYAAPPGTVLASGMWGKVRD